MPNNQHWLMLRAVHWMNRCLKPSYSSTKLVLISDFTHLIIHFHNVTVCDYRMKNCLYKHSISHWWKRKWGCFITKEDALKTDWLIMDILIYKQCFLYTRTIFNWNSLELKITRKMYSLLMEVQKISTFRLFLQVTSSKFNLKMKKITD